MLRPRVAVFLCLTLLAVTPLAADELVLIPLWYNGPGAEGSNWTTHLSAFNTGGYIEPNDRGILPCQWMTHPCARGFWQDKMIVYPAPRSMPGGFVMAVGDASRLQFSLRVFEESARMEDLGVDIPVVRERDLVRNAPVQLMDIPSSDVEHFRYTLRVYGIGDAPTAAVRLNGYLTMADGSPDLVMTKNVNLVRIDQGLGHHYLEDATFVRDLVFAVGGMGQIRVEIEPRTPNMRWWGFASSTNRRTQDVTIVTPN
ncbi:MAG TPA: hypothetical protein VEK57_29355 [Thermoanaerobaculia bacterium]|nr:hypothetical protein [Thermoanaerobaculia bacterium]